MKHSLLAALVVLTTSFSAQADVAVRDPEAFETAKGMTVGAALMGLLSDNADKLVGATTPVAERVEIHTMLEENGIMKMRKLEDGLELPKNKMVILSPNGYHLMLMGLKEPLKAETEFPLTLTFEKADPQTVTVKVLSRSALKKTLDEAHHDH
jgi:copper(I)-binding protein